MSKHRLPKSFREIFTPGFWRKENNDLVPMDQMSDDELIRIGKLASKRSTFLNKKVEIFMAKYDEIEEELSKRGINLEDKINESKVNDTQVSKSPSGQ
jgi:predicted HTH domain antitoxin